MKTLILISLLAVAGHAMGAMSVDKMRAQNVDQLLTDYFANSLLRPVSQAALTDTACLPNTGSCVDYIASRTGASSSSTLIDYAKACRGNFGQGCVKAIADRTGSSSSSTLEEYAQACNGNYSGKCVDYIASRTGSSSSSTLEEYATACKGNLDETCVKFMADRTGASSSSTLIDYANACGAK